MDALLALQTLELNPKTPAPEQETEILKLREKVPVPILAHFDRLIARGRKGVATVRNGACGECHLRLPSGTVAVLACTNDVHLCDNCGRYLHLPDDERTRVGAAHLAHPTAKKRGRPPRTKAQTHAA
jgi:predicted  nucleic acid-binding Zn-ribbon protein